MSLFTNKTLLITGGTGSFGNAVLNRFLCTDIGEIRIFSRDEKKQDDMRHEFQAKMPEVADKIKFYIGDVRNLESCRGSRELPLKQRLLSVIVGGNPVWKKHLWRCIWPAYRCAV